MSNRTTLKEKMKKFFLILLNIFCISFMHTILGMEDSEENNLLITLCLEKKEETVSNLGKCKGKEFDDKVKFYKRCSLENPEAYARDDYRKKASKLKATSSLDHISLFHRWGVKRIQFAESHGAYADKSFLIRLFGLVGIFSKHETFSPDHENIDKLKKLFSKETLLSNMCVKTSKKSELTKCLRDKNRPFFTAYINVRPWQDFFFDLMPWPNRNPYLYAGIASATTSAITGLGV